MLGAISAANAYVLYDFEAGIANVSNGAGFGFGGTSVSWETSGIGATSGTGSLKVTAPVHNFSWGAIIHVNATPANVAALAAASAEPSMWTLEWDVTLDPSTMPDWTNFVNGYVVINSQNGSFDQSPTEPWLFGGGDTWGTKHVVQSYAGLEDANANSHGGAWLEMGFSINGDWGSVPGSMYIDTIRLLRIPEPGTLALAGLGALAIVTARRGRRE